MLNFFSYTRTLQGLELKVCGLGLGLGLGLGGLDYITDNTQPTSGNLMQ